MAVSCLITSSIGSFASTNGTVEDFVKRLYSVCLDREPDSEGLKSWTQQLENHELTGAGAAYGFIYSEEFQNKNATNEQYVEYMYQPSVWLQGGYWVYTGSQG